MRTFDVAVIGGGINGCGIARDAAGRGYSVSLTEQNDLGSGTSSWSTKLIHGGLRYLEHYEFRLVREALLRLGLTPALPPWGSMALMPAASAAAALVVHRLVERPLTRALRRRLDPGAPQNRVRAEPGPVPPGGRAD